MAKSTRAGRQRLKSTSSKRVRPTTSMVREAVFDIIGPRIKGCKFLDLYAGIGTVGIEALRLGASRVTFVEESRECCRIIRRNLETLGVESKAYLVRASVFSYLSRILHHEPSFDVIFMDPPYDKGLVVKTLRFILEESASLLARDGLVVVQHSPREPVEDEAIAVMTSLMVKRKYIYGDTRLTLFLNKCPGNYKEGSGLATH